MTTVITINYRQLPSPLPSITIYYRLNYHHIWPWARPKAGPVINRARSARGRPPRKLTFYEKRCFRSILAHFGPSRPHKWIRLEILHLWVSVSCQTEPVVKFYDQITVKDRQLPSENVNYVVKITFHDSTPNYMYIYDVY